MLPKLSINPLPIEIFFKSFSNFLSANDGDDNSKLKIIITKISYALNLS